MARQSARFGPRTDALRFPQVHRPRPASTASASPSAAGERHYIGEASRVSTAGSSTTERQARRSATNLRLNALLNGVAAQAGGRGEVAVVTARDGRPRRRGDSRPTWRQRAVRLLIENAALVAAGKAGTASRTCERLQIDVSDLTPHPSTPHRFDFPGSGSASRTTPGWPRPPRRQAQLRPRGRPPSCP